MKKILTIISSFVLLFVGVFSIFVMTGCDYSINYKETSKKLNYLSSYLNKSNYFENVEIQIGGSSYNCQALPKVDFKDLDAENYLEISLYYDTAYAYAINYIYDSINLLSTEPTIETLTEAQENLYKDLNKEIDEYFDTVNSFEHEIKDINNFYEKMGKYGATSKETHVLNYKKAYKDFIVETYDFIDAVDLVADQVYKNVDYRETTSPFKETYKSFVRPINLKIIYGYFNFIVESFDCRVASEGINPNEYKKNIVKTYNNAKASYISFFKDIIEKQQAKGNLTKEEIETIRKTSNVYLEEMEIYKKAHERLNFVKFFFEDGCALDKYIEKDYANNHYYNKINEYLNYTVPSFTSFLSENLYK